jgi:microcompartment protein CcmL/EutN
MLKAANVELTGPMKGVGSALVSAVVTGDVAAVNAAIEAGAETAGRYGEVVSAHVIARPHDDTDIVVPGAKAKRSTASK